MNFLKSKKTSTQATLLVSPLICVYAVWRSVLGYGPPADVRPMVVRMKSDYRSYKAKARKCAPEYQVFLESFNDMLVKLGWVYENPMSRWLAPRYRYANVETLDYKPFNMQTEPMGGLMPNLHVDLENGIGNYP
ncbi:Hypothetical protein PHPALM_82 [Phytophthora palmivora]|uniref:Uncharacterized protein n=1 Tax=Phytophthora palmivora TaxID=4796 RepID=A0A2P4YVS3_9STRA|nr:Hypothetical protein PHPALM_82 [Phytophthora palmivora]